MALGGQSARLVVPKRHMPMTLESRVKCTGKTLQVRELGVGAEGGMGNSSAPRASLVRMAWTRGEMEDEGWLLKSGRKKKSQCSF